MLKLPDVWPSGLWFGVPPTVLDHLTQVIQTGKYNEKNVRGRAWIGVTAADVLSSRVG